MERKTVTYSEIFKRQIVDEMVRGKYVSCEAARRAYGIGGMTSVARWVRKYGHEELLAKRVRIENTKERDALKEAGVRLGRDRFFEVLRRQELLLERLPKAPCTTLSGHSLPIFRNLI